MSLLKYSDNEKIVQGNGRGPLSFARAHIDGMPYRGQRAMLRDEEFDEFTEVVRDAYVRIFDLSKEDDAKKLNSIVDAASNGWFQIYRMSEKFVEQPDGDVKCFVYCVWMEPHRELNRQRVPVGLLQPDGAG